MTLAHAHVVRTLIGAGVAVYAVHMLVLLVRWLATTSCRVGM